MEKILIVVDMQNDFIDGALGTGEAAAMTARAASKIAAFDGRIYVTLDTHGQDYLDRLEGKKLPVPHCIKGTPGWELNAQIKEALRGKEYRTVEKGTFGSVRLAEEIAAALNGEKAQLELMGLCTDICVVSNALLLKAYFPELEITVDASCCAGVTPQTHQAALETMKMCQICVND